MAHGLGRSRRVVLEREKKRRPGLKAEAELGMRTFLFHAFRQRLETGNDLRKVHRDRLKGGSESFFGLAEALKEPGKKTPVKFRMRPSAKGWEVETGVGSG